MVRTLALLSFLLLAAPAEADHAAAAAAYQQGDWELAANEAQRLDTADGYAFAASALLTRLMVEDAGADREALAERAIDLAEHALQLDEDHVEARVSLAGALGFRGRYMSGWRAYLTRVPQRGRNLLEDVVARQPDNARALGMLGAWHLEVARRGGSRGLRVLDASVEAGMGYYSQAIALDPASPAPRYFAALGLAALDEPAYRVRIRELVETGRQLPPRDSFEAAILGELDEFAARLDDHRVVSAWADARLQR
ncbi:tetratricopeptide repeat protein [Maricaulis maris]|uniref:Tetratricopeptide repeat protein n=1 Tax=Maricaulis maris TaxID=74318 RepID=A0A495DLT4_9PROT|nr:hypothetical protein [Maricaulis maris]RKR03882.1 hypothetical protein C7435_0325 [Maricaulis maris]